MYKDEEFKSENRLTRQDYDKINEAIIKKNPDLGKLDERIIYDREFLLEVQNAGYNPLDKEDIQNFLEKKESKDINRNLILCGADKYRSLGQSEYNELDMEKFHKQSKEVKTTIKKAEDIYLSDISQNNLKEYLVEGNGIKDTEKMLNDAKNMELSIRKNKNSSINEDIYRKNIAKALGMDKEFENKNHVTSNSQEITKRDARTEKILELIKELRTLGFSPEEIKKEVQRFY